MIIILLMLLALVSYNYFVYNITGIHFNSISFNFSSKICEFDNPLYSPWNKKTILYQEDDDFQLADVKYHDIHFQQYIYEHNDYISNEIRQKGSWCDCHHIYRIFTTYLKEKTTTNDEPNNYQNYNTNTISKNDENIALDIGANIGSCTLLMMAMNYKTIAFEPLPKNLHLFTRTMLHNKQFLPMITLFPIALGNEETNLTITFNPQNMGGTTAISAFNRGGQSVVVPSSQLKTVLKNFKKPIKFAKIDVEGFEPYVIEGAENFFRNQQIKSIFYERSCQGTRKNINFFEKLDDIFKKYNYTSSKYQCRHPTDLFNVLVISNNYIEENNININQLKNDFF